MHSFSHALQHWRQAGRLPVIAEIKLATPQHGQLLHPARVAATVASYQAAGAACLSVVTGHWFGGSLALLEQVRALSPLPLLRKDFITQRRDIDISHAAGAQALLLTRRLLARGELTALAEHSLALGLTPFVELADAHELSHTDLPEGCVLAITNRQIAQRECDAGGPAHSLALAAQARARAATALVSASGIQAPQEVLALQAAGYDAALIGSALLRQGQPDAWLARLHAALYPSVQVSA